MPDTDCPILTTADGEVFVFVFGVVIGPGFIDEDGIYRVDGVNWARL